jgi:hypothetical protein
MAEKTLAQKLQVKAGQSIGVMNAPEGYAAKLEPLPDGATVTTANGTYDAVHLFVYSKADADKWIPQAIEAVKPGGMLWIAYPKKSGSIKTDITRDVGWEALKAADWHGVTQLSMDATWSFLRMRPRSEIKVMTRKF